MILLSAHLDRVIQDFDLSFGKGVHKGLLDNQIGVLLTYLTIYDDHNLLKFEQEGKIKIWHGKGEEWGRMDGYPKLTQKDIALVVDVVIPNGRERYDFILDNIGGFSRKEVSALKEHFAWEGFKVKTKMYDGNPDDQDESWSWRKRGIKGMGFMVPIQGMGWHRRQQDNTVSSDVILKCRQGLKRLIAYLLDE
jgi:hypothetical protein